MKVQLVSDIHVEFDAESEAPFQLPEIERDLLIVAGDLGEGLGGREFLLRELERSPVIYVLGNHEFYRHQYQDVRRYWSSRHGELRVGDHRLHVLDDSAVTLNGVRFIGSTLWADFDRNNPITKINACHRMSDYHIIGFVGDDGDERLLMPEDTYEAHLKGREFIAAELAKGHKRAVVVTHHAPHPRSIPHGYRDSAVNGCYVSDLSDVILKYQPRVWCHGHTHKTQDYFIGGTNVLCNPRGYARYEENPQFDNTFTFVV